MSAVGSSLRHLAGKRMPICSPGAAQGERERPPCGAERVIGGLRVSGRWPPYTKKGWKTTSPPRGGSGGRAAEQFLKSEVALRYALSAVRGEHVRAVALGLGKR